MRMGRGAWSIAQNWAAANEQNDLFVSIRKQHRSVGLARQLEWETHHEDANQFGLAACVGLAEDSVQL
jgi:hypothetical protein